MDLSFLRKAGAVMEGLILLILGVIFLPIYILIDRAAAKKPPSESKDTRPPVQRLRVKRTTCPNCGSPVMDRGAGWECGWCGDSGYY